MNERSPVSLKLMSSRSSKSLIRVDNLLDSACSRYNFRKFRSSIYSNSARKKFHYGKIFDEIFKRNQKRNRNRENIKNAIYSHSLFLAAYLWTKKCIF